MSDPPPPARGPAAHILVMALVAVAVLIAVVPAIIGRTRRVEVMRHDLKEVVAECRARYDTSRTAQDTAVVDAWRPPFHGVQRPGDPVCGAYRRRNMLRTVAP